MKQAINLLAISIVLVSCSGAKRLETTSNTTESKDSAFVSEVVTIDTLRTRADSSLVVLPIKALEEDTMIVVGGWRSSLILKSAAGKLSATCRCDSLEQYVKTLERKEFRGTENSKAAISNREVQTNPWWVSTEVVAALIGVVFFETIFLIITIKIQSKS